MSAAARVGVEPTLGEASGEAAQMSDYKSAALPLGHCAETKGGAIRGPNVNPFVRYFNPRHRVGAVSDAVAGASSARNCPPCGADTTGGAVTLHNPPNRQRMGDGPIRLSSPRGSY